MTVGQFDYPKAGSFKYHPNTKWYSPHTGMMHRESKLPIIISNT